MSSRSPPPKDRRMRTERTSYRDAPYRRDSRRGPSRFASDLCNNCKRPGHFARDCPNVAVCHTCGLPGHIAAECSSKGLCWNCKEPGHMANSCPNEGICQPRHDTLASWAVSGRPVKTTPMTVASRGCSAAAPMPSRGRRRCFHRTRCPPPRWASSSALGVLLRAGLYLRADLLLPSGCWVLQCCPAQPCRHGLRRAYHDTILFVSCQTGPSYRSVDLGPSYIAIAEIGPMSLCYVCIISEA